MTDLTLEELAELDAMYRYYEGSPLGDSRGYVLNRKRKLETALFTHRKALLAMARELVRLKSALDHLENIDSRQRQHFWETEEIYRSAKRWGWPDPLPPKGEG